MIQNVGHLTVSQVRGTERIQYHAEVMVCSTEHWTVSQEFLSFNFGSDYNTF